MTHNILLQKINDYIEHLPLNREPNQLYEPIRYILSLGGKRLRPVLMMLAYELWKDDSESILPQAVALETFHNFTLLHDDVMDHAEVRRGHATVHKKWDENTAILSGDNMLTLSFSWMQQCPADKLPAVLRLFTDTAVEIDEGQQYDMDFEQRDDVAEAEYLEMIRLKTSVLLACAVKIGAILAGASEADAQNLYKFGEALGMSFQLQDDYLDVYGDSAVFGKAIGGDITSNKKTYMLINALQRAEGQDKADLERWISATSFDRQEKIEAVTAIYNRLGIDTLAKDKMQEYYNVAISHLNQINASDDKKEQLRLYADLLMKRNK